MGIVHWLKRSLHTKSWPLAMPRALQKNLMEVCCEGFTFGLKPELKFGPSWEKYEFVKVRMAIRMCETETFAVMCLLIFFPFRPINFTFLHCIQSCNRTKNENLFGYSTLPRQTLFPGYCQLLLFNLSMGEYIDFNRVYVDNLNNISITYENICSTGLRYYTGNCLQLSI